MSDDPKKPGDPAVEPTRPDEKKASKLREVSEEKLKDILAAHENWLESEGKEGKQANLRKVNLQGAHLRHADLRKARLRHANLQGADLRHAALRKATLRHANLQGADLRHANLQGAKLQSAKLQAADLRGANLKGAYLRRADLQGADLRDANLQGAELEGAKLQKAILEGANLRGADLSAANLQEARMLGVRGLEKAKLRDINLEGAMGLLGSEFTATDITGAKLPPDMATFQGLDHVTEISKHARNIFLAMIGGCVFSWLTIATTTDVALLTNTASTPLPIIQTKVPIAGFYWAAPAILLALYFYLHFYLQSLWEGLASLPAIFPDGRTLDERAYPWLMTSLVREFVLLLTKKRRPFTSFKVGISISVAWGLVPFTFVCFWLRYLTRHDWPWTIWHILLIVVAAGFGAVAFQTALATLRGKLRQPQVEATTSIWEQWKRKLHSLPHYRPDPLTAIVMTVAVVLTVSVSLGAIEGKPGSPTRDPRTWIPALFEFVGYRTHADLVEVEVSTRPQDWWKADKNQEKELKGIKGANLSGRNLRHAAASGAFLAKANLYKANLEGATLRDANLQEADLRYAKLRDAELYGANLQGATLIGAKLQGARLIDANLQGGRLNSANLQGANLTGANLQGANLSRTNLQGAVLWRANLLAANLQWADLTGANLQGAVLVKAELESANLQGADLRGADLREAKVLTTDQLDEACGDKKTKLPVYMEGYEMKPCPEEPK